MKININASTIYSTIIIALIIAIYIYGILYLIRHYDEFKVWTKSLLDDARQKHQIIKKEFIIRK